MISLVLRREIDVFTFDNGVQKTLINLLVTIPIFVKGKLEFPRKNLHINLQGEQYNIPIRIVVMDKYPAKAPNVFVTPTATMLIMLIKQGRPVNVSGKLKLPYLTDWKKGQSNLKGLAEIMCTGNRTSEEFGTIVHFSI